MDVYVDGLSRQPPILHRNTGDGLVALSAKLLPRKARPILLRFFYDVERGCVHLQRGYDVRELSLETSGLDQHVLTF